MLFKRLYTTSILICSLLIYGSNIFAATPVSPNASPEARALLNFLYDIYGKKILSGQMYAPWGIDEISTVYNVTGKYPAIRGQDLINEPANNNEISQAIDWWRAGGIPTIMWHWGAPTIGEGYDASKGTVSNFDNLFVEGTNENKEMWLDLVRIADHLTKLRDANVPVLWRPMHECSGGWFWWDKSGGAGFIRLWRTMFDYFVNERGLNNLIWVLGYDGSPSSSYNPGDGYFDIVGGDTYGTDSPYGSIYNSCKSIHGSTIPVCMHECGTIPNPDQCQSQGIMWSWFMLWHTGHLTDHNQTNLRNYYNHDLVLTRDELPDIMTYLDDAVCTPTVVSPFVQLNGGTWQELSTVVISNGSTVTFGPHPTDGGTWKWSGPNNFSASTREIELSNVKENQAGEYEITFVNASGCTTESAINLTVEPAVTTIAAVNAAKT